MLAHLLQLANLEPHQTGSTLRAFMSVKIASFRRADALMMQRSSSTFLGSLSDMPLGTEVCFGL